MNPLLIARPFFDCQGNLFAKTKTNACKVNEAFIIDYIDEKQIYAA